MLEPCPRCGGFHPRLESNMDADREKNKVIRPRRSSRTKKNDIAETSSSTTTSTTTTNGGPIRKTASRAKVRHNPLGSPITTSPSPLETKDLIENFRCSICLEIFFEPVSLSCGHNFCKLCSLGRLIRNCPLCKSEVNNVVSLKVNSTLKTLVQQFFPQEYLVRENRWKEENEKWSEDVIKALEGGKLLTEGELYEGFRQNMEKRKGLSSTAAATDLPTRQQFLYFLAHLKKTNRVLALRGKPFFWFDPHAMDLGKVLEEFMKKRILFPSYMSKKKWQQNWCSLVLQKLKDVDEKLFAKAKSAMDSVFDEFEGIEEFNENTPSSEPGSGPVYMPGFLGHDPYSSDEYDSDDSDLSDY